MQISLESGGAHFLFILTLKRGKKVLIFGTGGRGSLEGRENITSLNPSLGLSLILSKLLSQVISTILFK